MDMKLITYLKDLKEPGRVALAESARADGLRCSAGHLKNVYLQNKGASKRLVNFIVQNSEGVLTEQDGKDYLYEVQI